MDERKDNRKDQKPLILQYRPPVVYGHICIQVVTIKLISEDGLQNLTTNI